MKYKLFIEKTAQKELSKVAYKEQARIISAIKNLPENPKPPVLKN